MAGRLVMSQRRARAVVTALAIGCLALGAHSQGPTPGDWPWAGRLVIRQCGTGRRLEKSDPFYSRVAPIIIQGIQQGLQYLSNNQNTPRRARALAVHLARPINHTFFFMCTPEEMNAPRDACAATRPLPFGLLVQFAITVERPACGCLKSTVFHEMLHVTSSPVECPAYRCAAECFDCAAAVPQYPGNGENCARYPRCCDP